MKKKPDREPSWTAPAYYKMKAKAETSEEELKKICEENARLRRMHHFKAEFHHRSRVPSRPLASAISLHPQRPRLRWLVQRLVQRLFLRRIHQEPRSHIQE